MEIKSAGSICSLGYFDLFQITEPHVVKAFAFLLATDSDVLLQFLHSIGAITRKINKWVTATSITIEEYGKDGRTDIEIKHKGAFHIVVEAKINNNNRIEVQETQYSNRFNEKGYDKNIMCFILPTHDRTYQCRNYATKTITWSEISELIDNISTFDNHLFARWFVDYINKNILTKMEKEILIQDVDDYNENLYSDYHIYRRDNVAGRPLYFAPYFTNRTKECKGISSISKVVGVIVIPENKNVTDYEEVLISYSKLFADENKQKRMLETWTNGISYCRQTEPFEHKYYLLDEPVDFPYTLTKKDLGLNRQLVKNLSLSFGDIISCLTNKIAVSTTHSNNQLYNANQ